MNFSTHTILFVLTITVGWQNYAIFSPTPRLDWLLAHDPARVFTEFLLSEGDMDLILQYASRKGYSDAMIELINHGARAYEFDDAIFARALHTHNSRLIYLLIKHKAPISVEAIEYALSHKMIAIIMTVLEDSSVDEIRYLKHQATYRKKKSVARFLRANQYCLPWCTHSAATSPVAQSPEWLAHSPLTPNTH